MRVTGLTKRYRDFVAPMMRAHGGFAAAACNSVPENNTEDQPQRLFKRTNKPTPIAGPARVAKISPKKDFAAMTRYPAALVSETPRPDGRPPIRIHRLVAIAAVALHSPYKVPLQRIRETPIALMEVFWHAESSLDSRNAKQTSRSGGRAAADLIRAVINAPCMRKKCG